MFPCNSDGDDIIIYDEKGEKEIHRLHHLRQQRKKAKQNTNHCLSDYILPRQVDGRKDYIGAFAVTAGIGIEKHVKAFEEAHDDYNAILLKALADRLAEALAEYMHAHVRKEIWGYDPNEKWDNADLIKEKYRGIRPAPGYPACPEHTEKDTLFEMLQVDKIKLTESFAMYPAASVSGWYFAHPDSKYFGLGKIRKDQAMDYAKRKSMTEEEAMKWLMPIFI